MSEENDESIISATDFARANNMDAQAVINQIKKGELGGYRESKTGLWYVYTSLEAQEKAKEKREAPAKAYKEFMESLKPVTVVKIDLSFGNILGLTFKAFIAGILVGVPAFILFMVILGNL